MRKISVIYWNNIPSPYIVERFNLLAKNNKIAFEAWFNEKTEPDRSWTVDESTWNFKYRYLHRLSIFGKQFYFPVRLLKQKKPDLLISPYAEPSFLIGWLLAKIRRIRCGFRVVATFDSWVKRARWKEATKNWLFPRVDFILTEGMDGRNYAEKYGAFRNRIFFIRHGIDVRHYHNGSTMGCRRRIKFRNELGVKGITFLYVGRLLEIKGLSYLLDAFDEVQKKNDTAVSLLLVGDGDDELILKDKCYSFNIKNVIFTGFCQKDELPKLYSAADVFVFPTLGDPYGLVVDEAMACGLPIISTSSAGEIRDRIENNKNGYIVPPKDSKTMARAMSALLTNKKLRKRMGAVSKEKITGHTHERWVEQFEQFVSDFVAPF